MFGHVENQTLKDFRHNCTDVWCELIINVTAWSLVPGLQKVSVHCSCSVLSSLLLLCTLNGIRFSFNFERSCHFHNLTYKSLGSKFSKCKIHI